MPHYTVDLSVGFFGGLGFFVLLLDLFWCVFFSFEKNALKITSGKQNVKLDWLLIKFFIVLYALGCVLGK